MIIYRCTEDFTATSGLIYYKDLTISEDDYLALPDADQAYFVAVNKCRGLLVDGVLLP